MIWPEDTSPDESLLAVRVGKLCSNVGISEWTDGDILETVSSKAYMQIQTRISVHFSLSSLSLHMSEHKLLGGQQEDS